MLHSTRGIVLTHVRYGETSAIVHIYTEQFGRQSYMVNSVRSARNKGKNVLMQPLTLLQMQVYHKPGKDIQRIKEFKVDCPFATIPFDQTKRSVAFFITEMMNRSFREVEANPQLFEYINASVRMLDALPNASSFHLFFLGGLTRYLGLFPDLSDHTPNSWFDLQNGVFTNNITPHSQAIDLNDNLLWRNIFDMEGMNDIKMNKDQRNRLTNYLIEYYSLHLPGLGQIKSLDILQSLYL
jgi:DNA repair protein RecO (recombination protein O)